MKPFECSDDVLGFLIERRGRDGDGDIDAIALFVFAIIEQERVEWAQHRVASGKAAPTPDETAEWYRAKPESYVIDREKRGEDWFDGFARNFLAGEIQKQKARAAKAAVGSISAEIGTARDLMIAKLVERTRSKGWVVGIVTGFVSNLIFIVLLTLLFFYSANKLDLADIVAGLAKGRVEVTSPGDNGHAH